jgi:hypothetical protein
MTRSQIAASSSKIVWGLGDAGEVHLGQHRRQLAVDDREGGLDGVLVGDVDADADHGAAGLGGELGRELLDGGLVDVQDGHVPAVAGQDAGDVAADAARGARPGDDGGAVLGERAGHCCSFAEVG